MSSGHPISFLISHHRQSRLKLFFLLTQTFSLSLSSHLLGSPVLPASRRCPNSRVQYSSFQSWRYRLAYRHCARAVCLGFCDAVLHLQEGFPILGENWLRFGQRRERWGERGGQWADGPRKKTEQTGKLENQRGRKHPGTIGFEVLVPGPYCQVIRFDLPATVCIACVE